VLLMLHRTSVNVLNVILQIQEVINSAVHAELICHDPRLF